MRVPQLYSHFEGTDPFVAIQKVLFVLFIECEMRLELKQYNAHHIMGYKWSQ